MKLQQIKTGSELVRAMQDAGSLYWDEDTKRFFRSRGPYQVTPCKAGVLFCTSEQFVGSDGRAAPRKWSVRLWTGETVVEVGKFNTLTRHQALALLKRTKVWLDALSWPLSYLDDLLCCPRIDDRHLA